MKSSILSMVRNRCGYHTVLKTNHGRLIYLALSLKDKLCVVDECIYLDRSCPYHPKKQVTRKFPQKDLLNMIRAELDKDFQGVEWYEELVPKSELIAQHLHTEKKRILLVLQEGNRLRTIFKNKFRREIYLEILLESDRALICDCHYCDARAKGKPIAPQGLVTIYYQHSLVNLLALVNQELEGGFTDVMISENHTITLGRRAICGSI